MSDITARRWETFALFYDTEAPRAVPCYRHLHAEIVRRVGAACQDPFRVADLGAGGGRLLAAILKQYPAAQAVWVDSSPVMRVVAGRRLARFNGRVTWVEAAMEATAWETAVPDGYNAVVSSIALHHLTGEQRQRLFARIHRALKPGGIVAIADEVLGGDWSAQKRYLEEWDQHTRSLARAGRVSPAYLKLWKLFRDRVFPDPEHNPTERWESAARQVEWLREAGFADAQVWWEHDMWAVFGGRKE
ncbi:MAG TPA: methyltransferase domain-containing protein [Armatimonadota bacterium]|jgi:tRNA (cmo5U34)-methyltransferase|nr:methyltransferase domain-containing protein [Armatimonadota bacterium]HOM83899.1 methyltransferase domain-containing protein [Armatimonadota bacterium]HOQ27390.1 methyltransferase domain-containing protein [Armatimonadota bacterium]HPO74015.1 methyltransferase domain-containing protein [Armatimonadota bacterium]HPT98280.1 methyltransferase domain-containing protein [Armatimonadota bacterium]